MTAMSDTNNPHLKSWVESANDPATDFPIQNLPLCTFLARHDGHTHMHNGVLIGDQLLDVSYLNEAGYFEQGDEGEELSKAIGAPMWMEILRWPDLRVMLRARLQEFLLAGSAAASGGQRIRRLRENALRPASEVGLMEPMQSWNYTDFYASIHHASTVGAMFRPDNPLLPNYKHVPIGYHGRASSIVHSGTPIRRPHGQQSPPEDNPGAGPSFGPCKMLDYELEMGCVISGFNPVGKPVPISQAGERIAGLILVNDWSARDVQKWEYQPLGPFLAKNFATSVGQCIVTREALEPFRCPALPRPSGDPRPLDYLWDEQDQQRGGFDITMEVYLLTEQMEKRSMSPHRLSSGRGFKEMYWTFAQMIAHHTSNGCNLQVGDLVASGTVSGPTTDTRGCLLELTWDGPGKPRKPIELPTGEKRVFLADGDTVIFRAFCEREGFRRIGFGECRGTIVAATTAS